MKETLKELRLDLDGLAELVNDAKRGEHKNYNAQFSIPMRNTEHALKMAKAWAGKALGTIGEASPYQNDGKRKTIADIEPTDAQVTGMPQDIKNELDARQQLPYSSWIERTHIERVDYLREEIQRITTNVESRFNGSAPSSRYEAIARTQIYIHLTEARMHLGFELERIRQTGFVYEGPI